MQPTQWKYLVSDGDSVPAAKDSPSLSPIYHNAFESESNLKDAYNTLYEMFENSVRQYSDRPCLGHRPLDSNGKPGPFTFISYKETAKCVQDVASALKLSGLQRGAGVGIYGVNSPEWMIAMQACNRMAYKCVPIYDSLGENAVDFIIGHSETTAVFVAADKLAAFLKALPKVSNIIKTIVYWGKADAAVVQKIKDVGVSATSWADFVNMGARDPAPADPPNASDLCTLMYTSGTTGDPKGVMITHTAVMKTISFLRATLAAYKIKLNREDVFLSFLPLAHIFDRVAEELMLEVGASIGYWQGSAIKLTEDIAALRPTVFVGVPRIFDRIYSKAMSTINSSVIKGLLFRYAKSRKLAMLNQGRPSTRATPFWDWLLFSNFKTGLGGRVRVICSGSAPLAPHVEEFLRVTMCCPVVQGYGLTESCAASFIAAPDNMAQMGTVGPPFIGVQFRLQSVPEMGYDALEAQEPKGELLIRSPQIFSGYYKNKETTDEALKDGWFSTGDIGAIVADGALKIIDRKKNIFKLSIGEYIAAERLESVYKKNLVVDQVWVYGNSYKNSIVAVVVPQKKAIMEHASSMGLQGSFEELCANPAVAEYVQKELSTTARSERLKSFEVVKAVILDHEPFTPENDMMTPSFKLKRAPLLKKYQKLIDQAYTQIEKAETDKEAAKGKAGGN